MRSDFQGSWLSVLIVWGTIVLSCMGVTNTVQAVQDEADKADKQRMLAQYEAAMADGKKAKAIKYVVDYSEKAYGENSPVAVKLMHRYGNVLYDNGDFRKATGVLRDTLKRSIAAHGKSGGSAFEINMNIGFAYSQWHPSLSRRTRYFNRGLEILRERGQHESIAYVTTLVNIITNMMENDGLKGDYSSTIRENLGGMDDFDTFSMEHEYYNSFPKAEKYVLEAVELAKKLENVDEYLSSKIAIAQAKLNVMKTVDLAAVPMGVDGYISGGTEKDNYNREEERLLSAIQDLSQDIEKNQLFVTLANKVRMDIAWMSKDKSRMATMCESGTLNDAGDYPSDRLFDVMEDGTVVAPTFNFRVPRNIFKPRITRGEQKKDRNGMLVRKPHFSPVCIDGRLMAALLNAPMVSVEEVER